MAESGLAVHLWQASPSVMAWGDCSACRAAWLYRSPAATPFAAIRRCRDRSCWRCRCCPGLVLSGQRQRSASSRRRAISSPWFIIGFAARRGEIGRPRSGARRPVRDRLVLTMCRWRPRSRVDCDRRESRPSLVVGRYALSPRLSARGAAVDPSARTGYDRASRRRFSDDHSVRRRRIRRRRRVRRRRRARRRVPRVRSSASCSSHSRRPSHSRGGRRSRNQYQPGPFQAESYQQ